MKIKRLEIVGFKSFVDKVSLDFQQGITGVIGPNGCGKSNVVDAIRWAMGEQNVRHLRGRTMEDIIFGGSETRKPHGMAQVSIVFDNSAKLCPEAYKDFSEVMVTRRLYRNGDSDYMINKTPCRLLDITELFMDTGVGPRAYSIIEQGKVGMLVSAKPEERRVLIEEVAGVTKFKARKKSAVRKMDATKQNLVRLGDIITEVRRQIGSLKRQAQKAERFRDLRAEYKRIELSLAGNRYQKLQKDIEVVAAKEKDQAGILSRLDARLEDGEVQLEEKQLLLTAAENDHKQAQEKVYHLGAEVQRVENELALVSRQTEQLEQQDRELKLEIDSSEERVKQLQQEYENIELKGRGADIDLQGLAQEVTARENELQQLQQREAHLSEQYESYRNELMDLFAQGNRFSNRCEDIDRRLVAEAERRELFQRDSQNLKEQQELLSERYRDVTAQIETVRHRQNAIGDRQEEWRDRIAEQKVLLQEKEKEQNRLQQDLNLMVSRRESLEELQLNFEGYEDGARILLKEAGEGHRIFADILRVPAELEVAVEAALEKRLQAIPVEGPQPAQNLLQHLQDRQARASLVLPTGSADLPGYSHGEFLADKVTSLTGYESLVKQLLAGTFIVDNIADHLKSELAAGILLVDRDGSSFDWQGVLSGGSAEVQGGGLLKRQRQLDELDSAISELEQRVEGVQAQFEAIREDQLQAEESLLATTSEVHRLELEALDLAKDRQSLQAEQERLNKRLELVVFDLNQIDESEQSLQKEKEELLVSSRETGQRQEELETLSRNLQSQQFEQRSSIEKSREELTGRRVELASLQQQQQSLRDTIKRVSDQRQEMEQRVKYLVDKKTSGGEEKERLAVKNRSLRTELDLLLDRRTSQQQEHDRLRERYEGQRIDLDEFREQMRRVRTEAEDLRKVVSRLQVRHHELQVDADNVRQNVLDRYRIDLIEHQVPEATDDELERQQQQLHRLQQKIDALGEVNLMAIEEYREQEERYDFLSGQRDDLNQSLDDLQKAINQINRTTRRRFKETFELVNAKFQRVFPRLFRGGKAELRLTDENDLLETGVEIIVQPPGKRLQNVNLLSGGEKALTAVALIFSLFLIKPTPFCILDEVDAPLDDANIDRFAEMVREMTAQSQFIIITHSKRTMSVLDTMYGVTMQEPGVSRLVSVRMHGLQMDEESSAASA